MSLSWFKILKMTAKNKIVEAQVKSITKNSGNREEIKRESIENGQMIKLMSFEVVEIPEFLNKNPIIAGSPFKLVYDKNKESEVNYLNPNFLGSPYSNITNPYHVISGKAYYSKDIALLFNNRMFFIDFFLILNRFLEQLIIPNDVCLNKNDNSYTLTKSIKDITSKGLKFQKDINSNAFNEVTFDLNSLNNQPYYYLRELDVFNKIFFDIELAEDFVYFSELYSLFIDIITTGNYIRSNIIKKSYDLNIENNDELILKTNEIIDLIASLK